MLGGRGVNWGSIFIFSIKIQTSTLARFWQGHWFHLFSLQLSTISYFLSLMKAWDLAKKSDFTPFLSSGTENENFLHTMMIYIENGTHGQILTFFVKGEQNFCFQINSK